MEKNTDSEPNRDEESCHEEAVITKIEKPSSPEPGLVSSSAKKELTQADDDDHADQLESAKAEMDQLMEENQRLKMYLNQILKDYRSLQTQYHQDHGHDKQDTITSSSDDRHDEEPELIALSLGRTSSGSIKYEHHKTLLSSSHRSIVKSDEDEKLTLGLNSKFEAPNKLLLQAADQQSNTDQLNSAEETKRDEQDHRQMFDPARKNIRERDGLEDDEITQENPVKRARVSVRVRCDTPTMNDGCQWRKYGQKISKGNPCPRAYYRCTVAPSCPVRKQVQRCADDLSILTTTYEGTHNHPLPISATSMASTTSAAASMLVSGSSSSTSSSSITAALNGLNAYLPEHSRMTSKPFNYLLNSSISTSTPYPTITLDLTSSPYASLPTTQRSFTTSRFSSATNLNFNTVESNPATWSNGGSTYSYGSSTISSHQHQPVIFNNKISQTPSSLSFGANPIHETSPYQSYLLKTDNIPNPNQQSLASPETIAAATKAITSDPNFQSALAAALSSIIGSSSAGNNNDLESQKLVGKSSQSSGKSSDHHQPRFPILSSFPPLMNSNKCTPSGFVKSSTSSSSAGSQPSSLMFLSPTFQLPNSKSKPNSPGDNRDRNV